jgi:hypothetical protein
LGGVVSPDDVAAPPNVTVRAYLPHAAVLPHASLVISHGGLSTIMAALAIPFRCCACRKGASKASTPTGSKR